MTRFHSDITEKLLAGALQVLRKNNVANKRIKVVHIPGAFELPLACQHLALQKKFDALIALGCVIKGETNHHVLVEGEAARGIMHVSLVYNIPIGFGVVTAHTLPQARNRSDSKENRGSDAARAALAMTAI